MNRSKIYHTQTQYSLNNINAFVNIYTGKLTLETMDLTIGSGNYEMYVGHVYNSQFKEALNDEVEIGLGNGYKLNIQQYVLQYKTSMNFAGYNVSDYIYIDGQGNIHKFVKYTNNNVYYDEDGSGLRLRINEDGTKEITDDNDNKLLFDTKGRLTDIFSGINELIHKKIVYSDNKIVSFYDTRKPSNGISFYYQYGLIAYIYNAIDRFFTYYKYDCYNRLILITKSRYELKKDICYIEYNENNKVSDVVDCETLEALRVTYHVDKVDTVKYKHAKIEYITRSDGVLYYCGDDNYLGDDIYIGENAEKISNYYLFDDNSYEEKIESFEYNDRITILTTDNNTLEYSFDDNGKVVSTLKKIVENSGYSEYISLNEIKGYSMTLNNEEESSINNKINGSGITQVNEINNFSTTLSEQTQEYFDANYFKKYILSFFVAIDTTLNNYYGIEVYENGVRVSDTVRIGKVSNNFVHVNIPIELANEGKVNNLQLKFLEENDNFAISMKLARIANVVLIPQNFYKTYIGETCFSNIKQIQYINENNQSVVISFDLINYMSENDLYLSYKNYYRNRNNTDSYFDIVLNNNQKIIKGRDLKFITLDNEVVSFVNNYYIQKREIKMSENIVLKDIKEYLVNIANDYIDKVRTYSLLYDYSQIEGNDLISETVVYNEFYKNGLQKKSYDTNYMIKEYIYDDYGNLIEEKLYSNHNENYNISTIYEYYDSAYLRTKPDKITKGSNTIEFVYKTNNKIIDFVIEGNKKIKLIYDDFCDKVVGVSFTDLLTNKTQFINNITYDSLGNVSSMTDNKGTTHRFESTTTNNKVNKVYFNDALIEKSTISKNENYVLNNVVRTSDMSYKTDIYRSNNLEEPDLSICEFYEDDLLMLRKENNKDVLFEYNNDYWKKEIVRISDPFTEETNDFNESEYTNGFKFKSHTTTYIDPNDNNNTNNENSNSSVFAIDSYNEKYNYKIYSFNDGTHKYQSVFNRNNLGNFYASLYPTSLKAYIQSILQEVDTDFIDGGAISIEHNTTYVEPNFDYEYVYVYKNDLFGRVTRIINPLVYKDEGVNSYFQVENVEGIAYNSSGLVNQTSYKVGINGINNLELNNCLMYNDYVYDSNNNIIAITESGKYFETIPNKDTVAKTKANKTVNYQYDSYNRIISEDNDDFGNYEFIYDDEVNEEDGATGSGQLLYIKKNNQIIKRFYYSNGRISSYVKDDYIDMFYYDNYGNMLNLNNLSFTYNERNMLARIDISNPFSSVEYEYNFQGIRHKKIYKDNNGNVTLTKKYYFDGNKIQQEVWKNSSNLVIETIDYYYDTRGICGIKYKNTKYTLVKDILGNVSKVMNHGKLIAEYRYDAWGNQKIIEYCTLNDEEHFVVYNNPFRYRGYYYDVETNLLLVSSRYYSPELCRWISPDDIEYLDPESVNGLNLYCYCFNNPVNYIDPDGHFPITALLIGIGIGLFAGAVTSGISSALDGNTGWELIGDIVAGGIIGAALGAATTLGGLVGIGAIAGKTAIASFAISTVASFGAGVASYAIDKWTSNEQINVNEMLMYGGATALQSVLNFGIGMVYGASGNWDTLNQGVFGNFKREMKEAGYGMVKRFAGALAMYLKTAYKDILKRMIIRSVFNKSYDLLESLIY